MNKKLYKLMDWAFIEEVIYSECSHPQDLLGPHIKGQSTLVQAYFPGATEVAIAWNETGWSGKPVETAMDMADEDGFFAVLLPTKDLGMYHFAVTYEERREGSKTLKRRTVRHGDPYRHKQIMTKVDLEKFSYGSHLKIHQKMGAHPMEHDGEKGVYFAVWAPNAMRVSVIGDWNDWDGRSCQMKVLGDSGVFELFVPDAKPGQRYQFELKLHGGILRRVADPYANAYSDVEGGISMITEQEEFTWTDGAFVKARKEFRPGKDAISIYEVYAGDYLEQEKDQEEQGKDEEKLSAFAKMAQILPDKVKGMGFTHVEILPVMEHVNADAYGMQTTGYFAVSRKYGSAEELKNLINELHGAGIRVILDWVPSCFAPTERALGRFDGTCLYEHQDPRQGVSPDNGTLLFNYGRSQVRNFLISSGIYWVEEFHADGIRMDGVARMLYLDYGRSDGAWVANMYGGNENLEAIDFIRDFHRVLKKERPCVISIAEDSSAHPKITDPEDKDGLGFDYKWNRAYAEEYLEYVGLDPLYRGQYMSELADSMVYAFVDRYLLALARDTVGVGAKGLYDRFPGDEASKKSALRLSLGYLFTHPGGKLLCTGGDPEIRKLVADLNVLYTTEPAMHGDDQNPDCFEWLSNMNSTQCCISFVRKTEDPEEMLLVAANFSGIEQNFLTGVPYEGKYKEILNTDDKAYGGSSTISKNVKRATDVRADARTQSLTLKLPAQSLVVYRFIAYTESELEKVIEERIRNYTPIHKIAGKAASAKSETTSKEPAKTAVKAMKKPAAKETAAKTADKGNKATDKGNKATDKESKAVVKPAKPAKKKPSKSPSKVTRKNYHRK